MDGDADDKGVAAADNLRLQADIANQAAAAAATFRLRKRSTEVAASPSTATPALPKTLEPEPLETSEPLKTSEPLQASEPLKTSEPLQASEPLKTSEPLQASEPLKTSEPIQASEPLKTLEPEPIKTSEPLKTTEPEPLKTLNALELKISEPPKTLELVKTPEPEPQKTSELKTSERPKMLEPPKTLKPSEPPKTLELKISELPKTSEPLKTLKMSEPPKTQRILELKTSELPKTSEPLRTLRTLELKTSELPKTSEPLRTLRTLEPPKTPKTSEPAPGFERTKMEDVLRRRFFYDRAFANYGGVAGLYDLGPTGVALRNNLLAVWRQHFIQRDGVLELDCPALTPEAVLRASGHADALARRFAVRDARTGRCFRADRLLREHLLRKLSDRKCPADRKAEAEELLARMDRESLDEHQLVTLLRERGVKSPVDGNNLTTPVPFGLMFRTSLGPPGGGDEDEVYLRPETAQGTFLNFKRLLLFNQGRLPFAAAQIGSAFRNDVSAPPPDDGDDAGAGLVHAREFTVAEIEHFADPSADNDEDDAGGDDDNDESRGVRQQQRHPKFQDVAHLSVPLWPSEGDPEAPHQTLLADAVDAGTVSNQVLGYFMGRAYLYLVRVGVDKNRLRFRQRAPGRRPHYARDCWDAEALTASHGWVALVGCVDRGSSDLRCHAAATRVPLVAEKPKVVNVVRLEPNKAALGRAYDKADAKLVIKYLAEASSEAAERHEGQLAETGEMAFQTDDGRLFRLTRDMVAARRYQKTLCVEAVVPEVVGVSFAVGRIMYAVLEHAFRVRNAENTADDQRTYFSFPVEVSPWKCVVLPLSKREEFAPFVGELSAALGERGVPHAVDGDCSASGGSIGRRYARLDEIGVAFGVTVDFDTVKRTPVTATLRERDTAAQVRVELDKLPAIVGDLVRGALTWPDVCRDHAVSQTQLREKGGRSFRTVLQKDLRDKVKAFHSPTEEERAASPTPSKSDLDRLKLKQLQGQIHTLAEENTKLVKAVIMAGEREAYLLKERKEANRRSLSLPSSPVDRTSSSSPKGDIRSSPEPSSSSQGAAEDPRRLRRLEEQIATLKQENAVLADRELVWESEKRAFEELLKKPKGGKGRIKTLVWDMLSFWKKRRRAGQEAAAAAAAGTAAEPTSAKPATTASSLKMKTIDKVLGVWRGSRRKAGKSDGLAETEHVGIGEVEEREVQGKR